MRCVLRRHVARLRCRAASLAVRMMHCLASILHAHKGPEAAPSHKTQLKKSFASPYWAHLATHCALGAPEGRLCARCHMCTGRPMATLALTRESVISKLAGVNLLAVRLEASLRLC